MEPKLSLIVVVSMSWIHFTDGMTASSKKFIIAELTPIKLLRKQSLNLTRGPPVSSTCLVLVTIHQMARRGKNLLLSPAQVGHTIG